MGMGRATEKIEILNARPPLPAALVCRGIGQRNGEDVLHPRLVRGRYLETEPHVNIAYLGSLVCFKIHILIPEID
jgi:hypothetical protein